MSWYKKDNPAITVGKSTKSEKNYVQVPSSSPIKISTSPSVGEDVPSIHGSNNGHNDGSRDEKMRKLEAKREAIRKHQDFPIIRKRFYYLNESDIFKGFIKGKGNLREITQWLTENYNKEEILAKLGEHDDMLKKQHEREEQDRKLQMFEKMKMDYEAAKARESTNKETENEDSDNSESAAVDKDNQELVSVHKPESYHDELSPIKGRARTKSVVSPQNSPERITSTKVEIKKKISILDKYKFKPKQATLDSFSNTGFNQFEQPQKKRKLVRLSSLNDTTPISTPDSSRSPTPSLALPTPKFLLPNNGISKSKEPNFINDDEEEEEIDELDRLEQKIKQNRKNKKGKKASPFSDDELLEDDNMSDSMSEEDDEMAYNSGITTIDNQVLEFINKASNQDLIEICNIEPAIADLVIQQRPFQTIYDISENDFLLPGETARPNPRKRKKLGLRIVEQTANSLKGYKAIDSLIKTCSEYGDSISQQMKEWGVTITGQGELDVVELDPVSENVDVEIHEIDEDGDDDIIITQRKTKGLKYIKHKPALIGDDITLNNYQQVGVNWLNLLYQNKLSCILADEMGLGKTCQVISFMAHLKETQSHKGPHLVVVPASTIENWMREFNKFCPDIVVQAYYGTVQEREDLRYELKNAEFDVLVTTYVLAAGSAADFKFLRNQNFDIVVYDEGHFLKNSLTERYNKLMRLNARFRLLLTGTPLQNNLKELVSLLSFMLPKLFNDKKDDLQGLFNQKMGTVTSSAGSTPTNYNPLLAIQAIERAKTMMSPFVLRRKKSQVLQHLPAKCHEIIECTLTPSQKAIYDEEFTTAKNTRAERERRKLITDKAELDRLKKTPIPSSTNVLMSLRKASLHPLLFRTEYPDSKLKKMARAIREEPEYVDANETYIFEDMQVMSDYELNNLCEKFPTTLKRFKLSDEKFLDSGKVTELLKLLKTIIEGRKEKVLIFSLFTQVLDILERVMTLSNYRFVRLDGSTSVETRQDIIDSFYEEDNIPIFLLSTKAGGFGINLVAANNVIIFDQSFNPHDDKQAEDRAHRVGQKKEVTVYKFIVKDNIEQNILQLAENKLQLDQSISADSDGANDSKLEEKTASLFERLLF